MATIEPSNMIQKYSLIWNADCLNFLSLWMSNKYVKLSKTVFIKNNSETKFHYSGAMFLAIIFNPHRENLWKIRRKRKPGKLYKKWFFFLQCSILACAQDLLSFDREFSTFFEKHEKSMKIPVKFYESLEIYIVLIVNECVNWINFLMSTTILFFCYK